MPALRWDCKERGCFNWKKRPKIEVFDECLPGKIAFGDVDGIVEISGNALLLEWKGEPQELAQGQRIMYQRLTQSESFAVFMFAGDARDMSITHGRVAFAGKIEDWLPMTLEEAKQRIRDWSAWALKNPRSNRPALRAVAGGVNA